MAKRLIVVLAATVIAMAMEADAGTLERLLLEEQGEGAKALSTVAGRRCRRYEHTSKMVGTRVEPSATAGCTGLHPAHPS